MAIFTGLAGLIALVHTLQLLHLFPIAIGPIRFFTFDVWGALLWGISAAAWLWATWMLWTLNPFGWIVCVALSAVNLVLIILNIMGQATWQSLLPGIVINGVVLIYCLLPGTRDAFDTGTV